MKIFSGSFSTALRHKREKRFEHVVRILPAGRRLGQLAVVLALRMVDEQVLPDFEVCPGMCGLPLASRRSRVVSSIMSVFERKTGRAGPGLVTVPRTAV